ncbi:soluble calcium-activated nucleotidase 1 [Lycorma delicatula]|uniref:soluble calcium-activated nucleotidase 1 n=1 Tax=Lycorma delicatula TaxID=130591 RepID=UPI003F511AA5
MYCDNSDSQELVMTLRDWRKALRTPPAYRVGSSRLRIQTHFLTVLVIVGIVIIILLYASSSSRNAKKFISYGLYSNFPRPTLETSRFKYSSLSSNYDSYNSTYPLTPPVATPQGIRYRIGIISDLDKKSKSELESNTWISFYKKGFLLWNQSPKKVTLTWDDGEPIKLKTRLSENGRGMELSELVVFNGKLLTFDDRTGMVYEIEGDAVIPWVILMDGNGRTNKGFKSEWATVKDHSLYVGSMGKEWTTSTGSFVNNNPLWIKNINIDGEVQHRDWQHRYHALRHAVGIDFPGYMIHESGIWSAIHNKWFFLPRRLSKKQYDEVEDERRSTNILLIADENFTNIEVKHIGEVIPTHGYSSFKFIPGTSDQIIVALKSEEDKGVTATYIVAFDISGTIILPETKVADLKYEGIEFT